jgi:hypothetical protein
MVAGYYPFSCCAGFCVLCLRGEFFGQLVTFMECSCACLLSSCALK